MTFRTFFFFFGFAFERQAACSPKSKHWRAHTQQIVHPHMNTLRWTLLLTVLLTALLLAFASSLTLLIQNALHDDSSPSYTSGDQLAWRRVSNTNTPASDGMVESASPVA
ncbi:membrane-associated protein, putative, partial [Bodo saltans]